MAKIKKENKPLPNANKQNKKPAAKPQKPDLKEGNGVVKAKNKVKNGPPGKGKAPAKVNVPAVKAETLKVIKNKKVPENNQKPAKSEKPQQNGNVLKKQLKQVLAAAPKAAAAGKGPKPQNNSPVGKKQQNKNKAIKSLAPAAVAKPGKAKKQKKDKKVKTPKENAEEKAERATALANAPPFSEEVFKKIVTREKMKKIVSACQKLAEDEAANKKKTQMFTDYKFMLNVTCFKVPSCPKRIVKLYLKHSLVSEEDDVCLFVRDIKRGAKMDYEETRQQCEDLLKAKGVTGIKTIIPFRQLKKEYGSYEMKIKLSNSYDLFMCDGAIIGQVAGFLGSKFQKIRCTPYPVRLNEENLKREFKMALSRTSYRQGSKGVMTSIPIGTNKMTTDQLLDNLSTVIDQLKAAYPGGYENIRSLYLRVNVEAMSAVPIYMSLCRPPAKAPYVVGPKEEKMKAVKAKAKDVLSQFHMTNDGVLVKGEPVVGQKRAAAAAESSEAEVPSNKKAKREAKQNLVKVETEKKGKQNLVKVEPVAETKKKGAKAVEVKAKNAKLVKPEPVESESEEDDSEEDEDDSEAEAGIMALQKLMKSALKKEDDDEEDDDEDDDDDDDDDDDEEDDDEDDDDEEEEDSD